MSDPLKREPGPARVLKVSIDTLDCGLILVADGRIRDATRPNMLAGALPDIEDAVRAGQAVGSDAFGNPFTWEPVEPGEQPPRELPPGWMGPIDGVYRQAGTPHIGPGGSG